MLGGSKGNAPGVHTSFGLMASAPLAFQQEHGWDMWEGSQATGTELLHGTHLQQKLFSLGAELRFTCSILSTDLV